MKILVTGGTGYIGSHTVVALQEQGHEVVILDSLENSQHDVLNQIKAITGVSAHFFQGDIRNPQDLEKLFTIHTGIEAVIHFAAYKAVGESVQEPLKYYENNVYGTINLLKYLLKNNIQKVVFSSSCTVYGDVDASQLPINEEAPVVAANSPYGNTKQICEELLRDQTQASPLSVVSLRYFNPIGAHDSALIGELPIGVPNNLLPYITQTAIGKRNMLTVFGNDYPTPDGTCIRDYIHVVDLANAHVAALNYLQQQNRKAMFEIFNIGTGTGNSVLEVIQSFEKVSGTKLPYQFGPRRPGDVVQIYASCDKAKNILGWQATRNLDNCTHTAWQWEQKLAQQ
jgi:UDP-glucose 4-epimerase